jgi:hypothetical protein
MSTSEADISMIEQVDSGSNASDLHSGGALIESPTTDYPDRGYSLFSSVPLGNCEDNAYS